MSECLLDRYPALDRGTRSRWKLSAAEAREVHQTGGLCVGFLNPFDDVRWVRRILELDRDGAVDVQFFDRLKIGLEFDHAAARR